MCNKEALLQHVNIQLAKGVKQTGMPVIGPHERVPAIDDVYECHPERSVRKAATAPHVEFMYLRGASVNATVKYMMDKGWYPYHCKAKDMPGNEEWDNFAWFLNLFHCVYCFFEGIARTNDLARLVLLYVCYGEYNWQTTRKKQMVYKPKPVIFGLNKKMINGRSRFVAGVPKHFEKFIELFEKNPSWAGYLQDLGKGEPPMEYLIHIELGLRNYGMASCHLMGTKPLRSPTYWGLVDVWRKREAYIALARFLLGYPAAVRQWDCFLFSDIQQRQSATITFTKRHLPLSDGNDVDNFDGQMQFDWGLHAYSPKRSRKSTPQSVTVSSATPPPKARSRRVQVYDPVLDRLVVVKRS